jgi:hypothetical protein
MWLFMRVRGWSFRFRSCGGFNRVFCCSLVFSYNVGGRSRTLQGAIFMYIQCLDMYIVG